MREVVLDTETTGFSPEDGDRIVEVGCVELVNHVATGRTYQCYINPQRDMPEGAFAVHGLSADFLSDFPVFADVMGDLLEFLGDARLVIHNAGFDLGFLNAEFHRLDVEPIAMERAIDTVHLARRRFPGGQASLDALCRRFGIDLAGRDLHGALLDARLLSEVYLELIGGRQADLGLAASMQPSMIGDSIAAPQRRDPRPHAPTPEELAAHAGFVAGLTDPVWD